MSAILDAQHFVLVLLEVTEYTDQNRRSDPPGDKLTLAINTRPPAMRQNDPMISVGGLDG